MSSRIAAPLAALATVLGVWVATFSVLVCEVDAIQPQGTAGPAVQLPPQSVVKYWLEPAPPAAQADVVERGKWLFRQKGCFLCHGPEGQGGVPNRNYIKDTIPRLALAEQMKLEAEDVGPLLEQMKRGVRLDTLVDSPPVPQFNVVLAQYHSIQDVIRKGNPAGKKDPKKPAPPLNMPSWEQEVSPADIDAIIAYLLSAVPEK